jgi:hypothetical protein
VGTASPEGLGSNGGEAVQIAFAVSWRPTALMPGNAQEFLTGPARYRHPLHSEYLISIARNEKPRSWFAVMASGAKKQSKAMDGLDLPKDVQERAERRWAQKLKQQMAADQGSRKDSHATTPPGTQMVPRGKRARRPPPQAA